MKHKQLNMRIKEIRDRINIIDDELLRILNERTILAINIAKIKEVYGLNAYDPTREGEILIRLCKGNAGPLDNQAVTKIFHIIIGESLRIQREHSQYNI